jgi:GNAT superfamily N-acetyltransferase
LYVRPEFQRNGLGGRLVQWGVSIADESRLPVYIEGTEKGLNLYLKYGVKEVDRVEVDLEKWGGNRGEWSRFTLLYRPAKGS